jgi:Domain found in Dishevelled, Egl-10, and Pleckstrin (DEP)
MAKISYLLATQDEPLTLAWRAAFKAQGLILLNTPRRNDLHAEVVAALGDASNPVVLIDLAYLATHQITLIDWMAQFNNTYRDGLAIALSAYSSRVTEGQTQWCRKSGALGLLPRAHVMEMPQTMAQFLQLIQPDNGQIKNIERAQYLREAGFPSEHIADELENSRQVEVLFKHHDLTPALLAAEMEAAAELAHKDRLYHLKKYRECVVASDMVTWLAGRLETSRALAVNAGRVLQRMGYAYHVLYEQDFSDQKLFFRLARNEKNIDELFIQVVLQKLLQNKHGLVADRTYNAKKYADCFVGSAFVDWLVDKHRFATDKAIDIGRQLFDLGAFHHVLFEHPFIDGNYYYSLAKKPEA